MCGINLNNHCGIKKIHGGLSFVDYVGIPHTQINILKEFFQYTTTVVNPQTYIPTIKSQKYWNSTYLNDCTVLVSHRLMAFLLQLWDARKKGCQQTFQSTYQVTAVSFNDTAEQVISGGIDNDIKVSHSFKFAVLTYIHFSLFILN